MIHPQRFITILWWKTATLAQNAIGENLTISFQILPTVRPITPSLLVIGFLHTYMLSWHSVRNDIELTATLEETSSMLFFRWFAYKIYSDSLGCWLWYALLYARCFGLLGLGGCSAAAVPTRAHNLSTLLWFMLCALTGGRVRYL